MRSTLSLLAALVATIVFTSDASAFGFRKKKCQPKPTCGSCGSGYVAGGCR